MEPTADRPLLALCMIVLNAENDLKELLPPVLPHIDELCVVVDSKTTDKTVEVLDGIQAENVKVRYIVRDWNDSFADARTAADQIASARWIFMLDSDYRMTSEHAATVRDIVATSKNNTAYFFVVDEHIRLLCYPNIGALWEMRIHEENAGTLLKLGVTDFAVMVGDDKVPVSVHHISRGADDRKERIRRNLRMLELQIQEMPGDASTLYHLGNCYFVLDMKEKLEEVVAELLTKEPTQLTIHTLLLAMRARALSGNTFGANLALERAKAIAPRHPLVRLMVAEQYAEEDNAYGVLAQLDGIQFEVGLVPYPVRACGERAASLLATAKKKLGISEKPTPSILS